MNVGTVEMAVTSVDGECKKALNGSCHCSLFAIAVTAAVVCGASGDYLLKLISFS
jgi:hypothetical protein